MQQLIEVTKEAFDAFVANYPRPLERDVVAFCEPARVQYNDFSLGDWPASVVAQFSAEHRGEPAGKWMIDANPYQQEAG